MCEGLKSSVECDAVGLREACWSLCGTWEWNICLGVRTGPLPGEDTLFPLLSSSLLISGLWGVGSGVERVGGRQGEALAFHEWFGSWPPQRGWVGSGLGPGGSGRDLLGGWLRVACSRQQR